MTSSTFTGEPSNKRSTKPPVLWVDAEPRRLTRDLAEVGEYAPALVYQPPCADGEPGLLHGGWVGELPRWPFGRPVPEGLNALLGGTGLQVIVAYQAAYPMVPPLITPVDPEPTVLERTQSAWHVLPGGSLCLMRSVGAWLPEASIAELLAKAAGWRIEYALMKVELLNEMTVNGIVSDPSLDHLVATAAERFCATEQVRDADGSE